MINCSQAVEKLWDFLENDLSAADRERVEEHLAFCRRCCGEVEFARELSAVMQSAARPAMPEDIAHRLERFVDALETGVEASPS